MRLEIAVQNLSGPAYCHVCGGVAHLEPGPTLVIAGTLHAVCGACGEQHAPGLMFQVEMQRYVFAKQAGHRVSSRNAVR